MDMGPETQNQQHMVLEPKFSNQLNNKRLSLLAKARKLNLQSFVIGIKYSRSLMSLGSMTVNSFFSLLLKAHGLSSSAFK
jgi:hypothetical protein